jgi:hypothetical protein
MRSGLGRSMIPIAVGGAVVLMTAASVAFGSNPPLRTAVLPPVVVTAPAAARKAEPHPEIRAAIRSLERAKDHLQHAAHDFGGHRVDAIAAIDAALRQLHIALDYDK